MPMKKDESQTAPKLDPEKLLGFRNMTPVSKRDGDPKKNYGSAFNKIGTEGPSCG
jgi:hypothetical protein